MKHAWDSALARTKCLWFTHTSLAGKTNWCSMEPPSPWTETVWFSWMVPERNLLGYWYTVFRANLGIVFGGVLVFDDTAVLPWELPVLMLRCPPWRPFGLYLRRLEELLTRTADPIGLPTTGMPEMRPTPWPQLRWPE